MTSIYTYTHRFTTSQTPIAIPPVVTPPPPRSGGGGGGGGGGSAGGSTRFIRPTVISTPGQVLGASAFFFPSDLRLGMTNNSVTELQKRLTSEGLYSGPITGYFGPLTLASIKNYQTKYGISPSSGFVGPLTRTKLNANQTAIAPQTISDAEKQAKIASIRAQLAILIQLLADSMKTQ